MSGNQIFDHDGHFVFESLMLATDELNGFQVHIQDSCK